MATTSLFSLLVFVWGFASWAALGQEEIRPRLSEEVRGRGVRMQAYAQWSTILSTYRGHHDLPQGDCYHAPEPSARTVCPHRRRRRRPQRVVFQLETGDIEFALLPEVAPVTTKHIFTLVALGCYTSNHFFRVDKGFVAQTADVSSGRTIPLNAKQRVSGGVCVESGRVCLGV